MPKKEKEKDFVVFEENWEIVMMFLRLQTQWNVSMSGVIGLKYEVLEWFCRLYLVDDAKAMLEGIQTMERTALKVLNEKDK
jgi:hypothetical protein|tara:strand:- start:169 stop:411 length:243 start_codon:yes stop_codon:yes gene_type:complete